MRRSIDTISSILGVILLTLIFSGFSDATKSNTDPDRKGINVSFPAVSPPVARDYNSDPNIVEVRLIAEEREVSFADGQTTVVWTYEGGIPGPTIEAEVGNTLIVHFLNRLPEETTLHWHGMEVPANMDGSNISQVAVQPGAYFRYEFKLLNASTFWYHPHVRTNVQVEKGLYGALIVRDPAEDQALGLPTTDHVLVLDDILLDDQGVIAEPFPSDPLENAVMQVNGREGNILLVNGIPGSVASVERGVPQRLRLINASNVRFMRVSLTGHRMWRIGGDGGLLESPIEIPTIEQVPEHDRSKGITLTPGERADVIFTPSGTDPIQLEWHDSHRGRHRAFYTETGSIGLGHAHNDGERPSEVLMTFLPEGPEDGPEYIPPSFLRDIPSIDITNAAPIPVMFGHTPPNADGDVTFFAQMKNGMPLPFSKVTADDAPMVQVGETRIWEVNNLTGGEHNFHPHGFSFQLIETVFVDMDTPENNRTVPAAYQEIKDTIILPARSGAMGRSRTITRLAVYFDDTGREGMTEAFGKEPGATTSGGWVFHCHLLEHSARGMMSFFQVQGSVAVSIAEVPREDRLSGPSLSQNYPNPFSQSTSIRYILDRPDLVEIDVYNLLGQKVETLVARHHEAGQHEVQWDASSISKGVYFYRLKIGDRTESRQLIRR